MAKITWFGHASFKIEDENKTILIDPWFDGNPASPINSSEIVKADIVYVTHDHDDHIGDAIDICKRTNAILVSTFELGNYAGEKGVKEIVGLNIGGCADVKGVKIHMFQAFHTCSKGAPTSVVVEAEGKRVYHAGDTGLFGDMKLIGQLYKLDLAILPIGGYYTMGATEAAEAVKLLKPEAVIPMHYKTFPVLAQSAEEFAKKVKKKAPKTKVVVLNPGGKLPVLGFGLENFWLKGCELVTA